MAKIIITIEDNFETDNIDLKLDFGEPGIPTKGDMTMAQSAGVSFVSWLKEQSEEYPCE